MDSPIASTDWSRLLDYVPAFSLLVFALPIVAVFALRIWLAAKAASGRRKPKQWVVSPPQGDAILPIAVDSSDDADKNNLPRSA